jgi:hypothetical protein
MPLDDVLAVLEERHLSVYLAADGSPRLRGPAAGITAALREALEAYREEIVERLGSASPAAPPAPSVPPPVLVPRPEEIPRRRPREWLWRAGLRYTEHPLDHTFGRPGCHPAGAWWWRYEGEPGWRVVPGRGGKDAPLPAGHTLSGLDAGPEAPPAREGGARRAAGGREAVLNLTENRPCLLARPAAAAD